MYHRTRYPIRRRPVRDRPPARRKSILGPLLRVAGGAAVTTLVTAGINYLIR
ncbi:hypothetical protein [Streptomyces cinereoruber]|uniref:hypothetical protein n=1 Tax=Streptomyces cinereoruber TaxID=67260 RepID=UPI00362A2EF0